MLNCFVGLLLLLLIAEVAVGIVAFVARKKVETAAKEAALDTLKSTPSDSSVRKAWDEVQRMVSFLYTRP